MEGWNKLQSSIVNLNLGQSANRFAKGFNSSYQATRERLGQVAPDEITELPQGTSTGPHFLMPKFLILLLSEYKDLEEQVEALKTAHLSVLKCVSAALALLRGFLNQLSTGSRKLSKVRRTTTHRKSKSL
jgi:hypothetical protein